MKENKDYENRSLWYVLYICIIKKLSADDALQLMGEKAYGL